MKMMGFPGRDFWTWRASAAILVLALCSVVWMVNADSAMLPKDPTGYGQSSAPVVLAKTTDDEDQPDVARATWIGVGDLRKFTITNTGLLGLYEQPPGWSGYDGTWDENTTNWNGWCAEFPAGSMQYYNFSTGPWIGAICPVILGNDTTWVPRVATGAYTPDMTPMSPLRTSDQMFPETDENAGSLVYAPSGQDPLPYQEHWPYADSAGINPRRRDTFDHNNYALDPGAGDIISLQDTWCVYGDWVPEEEANFLWPSFGYDIDGLGLRVEQRTYSWSYGASSNYVFIDFRIKNMNDWPLDSLYFGFFMDNDVGHGDIDVEGMGPNDDLIGYDEALKLGYTYDSDLKEPGWPTSAGYIGCVFVETPTRPGEEEEIGLTAFSTWVRIDHGPEGIVDNEQQDPLKYAELVGDPDGSGFAFADDPDPAVFEIFEEPRDVRHLSCSGPYRRLMPGEQVIWTLAIVMGRSLAELKENTLKAQEQFNMGYMGDAPPPSPEVVATAGDQMAFLTWDDSPEEVEDLITGEKDFEGYRIYRSISGLAGTWEQLAEYDIAGDSTGRSVQVKYARGNSVVTLKHEGFYPRQNAFYVEGEYLIEFASDTTFTMYNNTQQTLYQYKENALDTFNVFGVFDPADTSVIALPVPGNNFLGRYLDGGLIYTNGFFFSIAKGDSSELHPPGTVYQPQAGDLFTVRTFLSEPLSDQVGLRYFYTDEGLTNGLPYYYSVTSFDKGYQVEGLESLESATSGRKYAVIPRSNAAQVDDLVEWSTQNSKLIHFAGAATGSVFVAIAQPVDLQGDDYSITFIRANQTYPKAGYWRLTNESTGEVLLDSMFLIRSDTAVVDAHPEVVEGLRVLKVQGPKNVTVRAEGEFAGQWTEGEPGYNFNLGLEFLTNDPYDFEITFPPGGSIDKGGTTVPWLVTNISLDEQYPTLWYDVPHPPNPPNGIWDAGDQILIYDRDGIRPIMTLLTEVTDDTRPPTSSSVFSIVTNKPFTDEDEYQFSSNRWKSDYSLDRVTVVPNPYYVRAPWDRNRFDQWVYFQHLPAHCTIRIFTTAGLLIQTLKHHSAEGDGSARWNLLTSENMRAVSGLYIYQVEAEDGKTAVGKFAIIR